MKSRTSIIGMKLALIGLLSHTAFPGLAAQPVMPLGGPANLPETSSVLSGQEKKEDVFAKLPLRFEANLGQLDNQVKFFARNAGYTVYLTAAEALFMLGQAKTGQRRKAIKMSFPGSTPPTSIVGLEQLPGQSNYFTGAPATWRTGVPGYARVKYEGLYPGVDLVYYSNGRELEYDFQLAPGINPSIIRLQFSGADNLRLNAAGDLILRTQGGELRQQKPFAYQVRNGVRQEVPSRFVLQGRGQVSFVVAGQDANLPLVIDPALSYATYLGGSDEDSGQAIATNGTGIYVTGDTDSSNFPTTPGLRKFCCGQSTALDAFVVKLSADGTQLIYATYLGGSLTEQAAGIAVDNAGNAYVTGKTGSTNFPTTMNAYQRTRSSFDYDAFVTKLSATGTLAYSTYLGSSANDEGNAIAVDNAGNAYVTGMTAPLGGGTKLFPVKPTPGAIQTTDTGNNDAFVTKINTTASGISSLVYSTLLGGDLDDGGTGIALSSDGSYAVVTGYSYTPRSGQIKFPVTAATAYQATGVGGRDAFLTKMRFTGDPITDLVYSTLLGGTSEDRATGVALDAIGNAYLVGYTYSTSFPTKGAFSQGGTYHGSQDAFVAKINPNASKSASLVYSSYLGGTGIDEASGVAVDAAGQAYVSGQSQSVSGFPTVGGTATLNGPSDAFLTIMNATGNALSYSTLFGGSADDEATGVSLNTLGICITGFSTSTNFPTTPGALQGNSQGGTEAFIVRFQ